MKEETSPPYKTKMYKRKKDIQNKKAHSHLEHTHRKPEFLFHKNNHGYLIMEPICSIFLLSFTEPSKEAASTKYS